eukprot:5580304-Prymnesium_polylepis.1
MPPVAIADFLDGLRPGLAASLRCCLNDIEDGLERLVPSAPDLHRRVIMNAMRKMVKKPAATAVSEQTLRKELAAVEA